MQAMARKGLTPHTVDSYLLLDWGPAGACGHYATLYASHCSCRRSARFNKTAITDDLPWINPCGGEASVECSCQALSCRTA